MQKVLSVLRMPLKAPLTLVVGLFLTTVLFIGNRQLEDEKVALAFAQRAAASASAVQHGLNDAVQVLSVLNQLFITVDSVSRTQFDTFTQPLLQRYPYIQAFNYHRFLPGAERLDYESRMVHQLDRNVGADFKITFNDEGLRRVAPQKNRYYIVDYLAPIRGNEPALGLDVSGNASVMQALERGVETGAAAATGMLQLAQASDPGFVVLIPVYRSGTDLSGVEARRRGLIGDTAAVFRAGTLVQMTLAGTNLPSTAHLTIDVYSRGADGIRKLVFHNADKQPPNPLLEMLPPWLVYEASYRSTHVFAVAGQEWHIVVSSSPVPFIQNHLSSLMVLLGGIMLTMIAAMYLQMLTLRSRRVQRLVEEKTTELRLTNALLSEDILARQQAEQALRLRERAIEASANAIIILQADATNAHYPVEYVNPAFERITGYSAAEMVGRDIRELESSETDSAASQQIHLAVREQREGNAVLRNQRKDGSLLWIDFYIAPVRNADGVVTHFVAALYDITSTKHYEAELEFQASRDALTGLANRAMLRDSLCQAIAYAQRFRQAVWVVFIDLDRFKFVNDTLGHKAGDLLLKIVADRLQGALREYDIAARLGGDEFVLVLPERSQDKPDIHGLQRIMEAVADPVTIEGHAFFLTCSIGISMYPPDGDDPEQLIKHADIAMYRAKQTGRNNFQFYTASMNEQALERLRIESDLRNALERSELLLYYQPKVDVQSGRISGMEALIRWVHPEFGMVLPSRFIGLAEETGLIVPIGAWVLREACMKNKVWQQAGHPELCMSVNISARQFGQKDLVQTIAETLRVTGLEPHCLELELTESMVMTDVENAIGVMQQLKLLGVKISIDDFGTGYSSLAYLKRFPIDVLKIDRSFVRDITVDFNDAAITVSIISLAHNLKLKVIAEGVETEAQLAYLRYHGCDEIQGYLFSRPLPPMECGQLLNQSNFAAMVAPEWQRD
jgi:diguanylate cyclase (GGDEF)-like protein/PAS domain S-box-containing protein